MLLLELLNKGTGGRCCDCGCGKAMVDVGAEFAYKGGVTLNRGPGCGTLGARCGRRGAWAGGS